MVKVILKQQITSSTYKRTKLINSRNKLGHSQGSRISPLLFICLMADLDLWTDQCSLSQYADDTQSLCIAEDRDKAVEMTRNEANNVIDFFTANDL